MRRVLLLLLAAAAADAKVRVLFLTGETDRPYHDWRVTTPFLRGALERTGAFDVKVNEEVRGIGAEALAAFDVLVLNYNGPRWGAATERAIEEFVRGGKGIIGIHGVNYGRFYGQVFNKRWSAGPDAGWSAYADLMGVTWKPENIGHAARHVFEVKWSDRGHPIARGLPPTFLANDELYHKMDHRPNAHILATAYDDPQQGGTGRDEPIIWTVPFGKGRAVHITLGHDLSAMAQPGFLAAFARGTEWAATGAVTLPAAIDADTKPAANAVRVLVATGGHPYPTAFYSLFDGYTDVRWTHATSQTEAFRPKLAERFDVIVLHDCYDTIGEKEREALEAFVAAGKGIVSTHHAIVDYTAWPWWHERVIGGKYDRKKSKYKEDVEVISWPVKAMASHPVLRGVGPIVVEDEVYKNMWHSPDITVLMETDHPDNDRPMVYIGPPGKARAIYIQLGHGEATMRHPGYRRLVHNAILWAAWRAD